MEQPSRTFQRMPLGYGPMPGPRQTIQGAAHDGWDKVAVKTCTVTFEATKSQLSSFLPHPCFRIDSPAGSGALSDQDRATASVSFTELRNLPWLAGRGYNMCGLYIHDVICQGAGEMVKGKYLSVLFENRADPIISGREELGYSKVFASLDAQDDADKEAKSFAAQIGWDGAVFGEIKMQGLSEVPPSNQKDNTSTGTSTSTSASPQGVLHYKYVPRTGCPGEADAAYPTYSPPSTQPESVTVEKVLVAEQSSVSFRVLGFQDLPTLHHIAAKLADIDIRAIVDARIVVTKGTTDLRDQRAIRVE